MGARVIALDIGEERRDLALKFGADEVVDPRSNDVVQAIRDLTDGEGCAEVAGLLVQPRGAPRCRALRAELGHGVLRRRGRRCHHRRIDTTCCAAR